MDNEPNKPQNGQSSVYPPANEPNSNVSATTPPVFDQNTAELPKEPVVQPEQLIQPELGSPAQTVSQPQPEPVSEAPLQPELPVQEVKPEFEQVTPVEQPKPVEQPVESPVIESSAVVIDGLPDQKSENTNEDIPLESTQLEKTEDVSFDTYTPEVNEEEMAKISEKKPENDEPEQNSKVGTIITVLLIAIISYGIWQTNKSTVGQNNVLGDVEEGNVTVNAEKEEGNVIITDSNTQKVGENAGVVTEKYKTMVYFSKNIGNDCSAVAVLERETEKKYESDLVNTVRSMLAPLSAAEKAQGWSSAIPAGTGLNYIKIKDNAIAEVSFSPALNNVAGSCAVIAIRSQVEKTILQFPYIKSVRICVESNCNQAEILQP